MKFNRVTMVNPQQIVGLKLTGCKSTRTVTSFAQKYGVPTVWYCPNKSQKMLLVDWNQFHYMWNHFQNATGPFSQTTSGWNSGMTGNYGSKWSNSYCSPSSKSGGKSYGKSGTKNTKNTKGTKTSNWTSKTKSTGYGRTTNRRKAA